MQNIKEPIKHGSTMHYVKGKEPALCIELLCMYPLRKHNQIEALICLQTELNVYQQISRMKRSPKI